MDTSLTLTSPAKLNLFLHINGRLPNGYHELQTVFQILDRGDEMTFTLNDRGDIRISPEIPDLPVEQNLIYKAAKRLQDLNDCTLGVDILLDKNLPMGGGVGGGSSNAATTFIALNHLWHLGLSVDELAETGLELGADVPVFIRGKSALAEGVGEKITSLNLPENWYVILTPECHVSTAEIFSNERLTRDTPKKKIAPASEGQPLQDFLSDSFWNDCESIAKALYPEISQALEWLSQFGKARMTGTGACCFVSVNSEDEAQQVLNEARSKFKGFIAKGVNLSPAHQRLNEAD